MKLLETVALLTDLPEHGLIRGQVGTIVEDLAPDVFLVEFSDDEGRAYELIVPEQTKVEQLSRDERLELKLFYTNPKGKDPSPRGILQTRLVFSSLSYELAAYT